MPYCDFHIYHDQELAYTCDECAEYTILDPGDIAPDGSMYSVKDKAQAEQAGYGWFILDDGTTYKVAGPEVINQNLIEQALADVPF